MNSQEFIQKLKAKENQLIQGKNIEVNDEPKTVANSKSGTRNSSAFISKLKAKENELVQNASQKSAYMPNTNTVASTVTKEKEKPGLGDYLKILGLSTVQGAKDSVTDIATGTGNYLSGLLQAQDTFNKLNPTVSDSNLQALINENPIISGFFDKPNGGKQEIINKVDNKIQEIYDQQEKSQEAYQNELAKKELNTLQQVGVDVASGVGGMIPSIVTSLATGGSGAFVPLFLSSSGGKMREVYDTVGNTEDSTRAKALLAGTLSGSVEMATEKLSGFTKVFGGTLELDKALSNYLTKNVTNEVSKVLVDTLVGMAGEGAEEAISEYADAFITKIYNDNGEGALQTLANTTPDALYAALIGGLTGAVLEVSDIVKNTKNAVVSEQQKKQVLKDSLSKAANEAADTVGNSQGNEANQNVQPQMQESNVVSGETQNNADMTQNKPLKVGFATEIQSPYQSNDIPQNTNTDNGKNVVMLNDYDSAKAQGLKDYARNTAENKHVKIRLKELLSQMFGIKSDKAKEITLKNVKLNGGQYKVNLYNNSLKKVLSSTNTIEDNIKLSVLSNIENILGSAEYVGSGNFNKTNHSGKNINRYDYFETPIYYKDSNVQENGQYYIVRIDVVNQTDDVNRFRTYKVDELDIIPVENKSAEYRDPQSKQSALSDGERSPSFNNSIHQNSKFDNVTLADSDDIRHLHGEKLVDDTKSSINDNNQLKTEKINQESPKNPNQLEKTVKVQKYEKAARNKLIQYLSKEFNVSPYQVKSLVGEWIDLAGEQMQSNNKVSPNLMKDIFNKMADNSYTVDDEMRMTYKDMIEDLRNTTFQLDADTRNGMSDIELRAYKNRNKGKFKLGEVGIPVDVKYQELASQYPEFFPSDLASGDMLNQIADVLDSLDDKYTRNTDILNSDPVMKEAALIEFNEEYNKFLNKMRNAQNVTQEQANKKAKINDFEYEDYKRQSENIEKLKREYNRVLSKTVLDAKGNHYLEGLMKGAIEVDEIAPEYRNDVLALYKVKKPYEDAKNIIATYNNIVKEEQRENARNHTTQVELWDIDSKRLGIAWELDTAERVIRDIAHDDAEPIIAEYFTPIHKNEAERTKFLNKWRSKLNELNLSEEEAAAVQLLGEKAEIDGKEYTEKDVIAAGLDLDKINHAVSVFRGMYNELHEQVNEVLAKTGNKTIEFRKDYFPHFIEPEPNTKLGKALKKVGINLAENNIPADIAGLTENFRPNKTWFGHALHRTSNKTAYNAIKGADKYLDGISNLIYHTEDIQKLRALDTEIRYQTSDEGFKKRIDEIYEEDLLPEERQDKLNAEYEKQEKFSKYGNLTRWLTNYTNNLANKKSPSDRQMENDLGRGIYTVCKELESRVAANMVAGNFSSAMSNFIPITQALGECKVTDLTKAMYQTMQNHVQNDGFVDDSVFLTNRKGSDRLYKTKLEKVSDQFSVLFQMIDDFVSSTIVRAKYLGNIDKGMTHEEAMSNADSYAASLMADRSKGAMPLIFERKNPVTKLFTMYQLEQNNQLRYLLKDLPRAWKDEAKEQILMKIIGMSIAAWCFNIINKEIFGRKSALSPIDMAFELYDTVTDDKLNAIEKGWDVTKTVGKELPFVGSILDGGRIPISSAFPDGDSIKKLADDDYSLSEKVEIFGQSLVKPLSYIALPFGAGQAWKSAEGIKAVLDGGVYKITKDGKKLKYPVDQNLMNLFQGFVGGKSSFKEAQEYYDNKYYNLSSKQLSSAYKAQEYGMDVDEFLALYDEVKNAQSVKDKDGKTVTNSASINKRKLIDSNVDDEKLRKYLYEVMDVSKTVREYTDNEWFLAQRKMMKYD